MILFLARRHAAAWLATVLVLVPLATVLLFFVSGEYRHPASLGLAIGAAVAVDAIWTLAESRLARRRAEGSGRRNAGPRPARAGRSSPERRSCRWPPGTSRSCVAGAIPATTTRTTPARWWRRVPTDPLPASTRTRGRTASSTAPRTRTATSCSSKTRLDLHVEGARALGDLGEARLAVKAARALASHDLVAGRGEYADPFLERAVREFPRELAGLASLEVVRSDPGLEQELSLLGAGRWREIEELVRRSDVPGALAFARAALKRAPYDADLQAEMGRLLLMSGREEEGLEWLERSCNGWIETPRCAEYAATYLASQGRSAQARDAAREARRRRAARGETGDR